MALVTGEERWPARPGRLADWCTLRIMRRISDVRLVGVGCIRPVRCPPHRPTADIRDWRRRAGKAEYATRNVVAKGGGLRRIATSSPCTCTDFVLACANSFVSRGAPTSSVRERVLVYGAAEVDSRAGLGDQRECSGSADFCVRPVPGLATRGTQTS